MREPGLLTATLMTTSNPPRRPSPDCPDSMRQEILDAARDLFVTEGYGSVSLRKIAVKVGCTPMKTLPNCLP